MAHSDTSDNVRLCFFTGCDNDVVCIEVYVRYRREPIHVEHSGLCATHAVSEGIRILDHCECSTVHDIVSTMAPMDMDRAVADNLRRRSE